MQASLMNYGALATKVRAMYGKRLKKEDFQRLLAMKSMSEIAAYLKQTPGWGEGLKDYVPETANRATLIPALRRAEYTNYMKLFHYLSARDKEIMHFPVIAAEMEEVMTFMRLAARGRSSEYTCTLPDYLRRESKIYYQELSDAKDYAGLLSAVRETATYDALQRIAPPDGSLPPYSQVEIIMQGYYYRTVFDSADKVYGGTVRQLLLKSFGQQIDLLNIIHALRVRRYFPQNVEEVASYILPIHYKAKPSFLKSLVEAKDEEAVQALLAAGAYGKLFTNNTFSYIEEYYYKLMYDFHHHQMTTGKPSVMSAVSYMLLKQIETKNLVHVIECVHYGVEPQQVNLDLLVF